MPFSGCPRPMGVRTASTMTTSRPCWLMAHTLRGDCPVSQGGRASEPVQLRPVQEQLGIVGSGAIACGLAAAAARHGQVVLWARSDASADRGRAAVEKASGKLNAAHVRIPTELDALGEATAVVEAVVEDPSAKAQLWGELAAV